MSELIPDSVQSLTRYNTRSARNLRPRPARLKSSYNSYFPKTTRLWNLLSDYQKNSSSLPVFKRSLRTLFPLNLFKYSYKGHLGFLLFIIRVGLSGLNSHLFKYNFIAEPYCPHCERVVETSSHFLLS